MFQLRAEICGFFKRQLTWKTLYHNLPSSILPSSLRQSKIPRKALSIDASSYHRCYGNSLKVLNTEKVITIAFYAVCCELCILRRMLDAVSYTYRFVSHVPRASGVWSRSFFWFPWKVSDINNYAPQSRRIQRIFSPFLLIEFKQKRRLGQPQYSYSAKLIYIFGEENFFFILRYLH